MSPAAFADGKLVTRKSHRKRPDPEALPIECTGLGGVQLPGAAAESQGRSRGRGKGGIGRGVQSLPQRLGGLKSMTMMMIIIIILAILY